MGRRKLLPLGSISTGTLRPEDVVPALYDALHDVAPTLARKIVVAHVGRDQIEAWDALLDELSGYAPPFCYVGASEGDGADIGVWISEDAVRDGIHDGEIWQDPDDGSRMPATASYRYVVSDHGNASLYHRNGRLIW